MPSASANYLFQGESFVISVEDNQLGLKVSHPEIESSVGLIMPTGDAYAYHFEDHSGMSITSTVTVESLERAVDEACKALLAVVLGARRQQEKHQAMARQNDEMIKFVRNLPSTHSES